MTTKEHRELARRLVLRGIEAYKKRLIFEEDLLNGEDKRKVLEQIDLIADDVKQDKTGYYKKRCADLQARLDYLHSLEDCDEEFEL